MNFWVNLGVSLAIRINSNNNAAPSSGKDTVKMDGKKSTFPVVPVVIASVVVLLCLLTCYCCSGGREKPTESTYASAMEDTYGQEQQEYSPT